MPVWGSWPAQAAWFAHQCPEALRRTRWLLGCPDYLTSRLICAPTALLSITESELAAAGLERQYFPDAWTPGAVIGSVGLSAAQDTHLSAGTPVVGGHVDGLLGVLGSGVQRPGDACVNCGTSATFTVVSKPPLGYPMFNLNVAGQPPTRAPRWTGSSPTWPIQRAAMPTCSTSPPASDPCRTDCCSCRTWRAIAAPRTMPMRGVPGWV